MQLPPNHLLQRCQEHMQVIYSGLLSAEQRDQLAADLLALMRLTPDSPAAPAHQNLWSEQDAIVISYADSLLLENQAPLQTLHAFLRQHLTALVSGVHILPFFPYSSDDGFAVMDFSTVNPALGDWPDISAIAGDFRLMADLVINHCSARSLWFDNFIKQQHPGADYFFTAAAQDDLSLVVRPRTSPLLKTVETAAGTRHVWCTFSHDQVDFDFRNPEVLQQFVQIIRDYLDRGVRIFRLDAIAFVWKEIGSSCLNLEQTHELVRLLRTLIEHATPDAMIITETNIPLRENLAYFGNANEAHCVYNFSLPPLLLNTLITGSSHHLTNWLMSMPAAQNGTCYFNFIASHDGIGLRPAEGLLDDEELTNLLATMENFGAKISWRQLSEGESKPYEINISLFDALQGTRSGKDQFGLERFVCAHAIMLALEGIPGIYIHSLLGTRNDYQRVENCGHHRAINRHQWQYAQLEHELADPHSPHHQVFTRLTQLLRIRRQQRAFHPNAAQYPLHLGDQIFGFWRQSLDRSASLFCISNISRQTQTIRVADINLHEQDQWHDLIGGDALSASEASITLTPYQTLWLSNQGDAAASS